MGGLSKLGPLVYLDTNIFVYMKEAFGERADLLVALLSAAIEVGYGRLATSEVTLAGLLVRPYAERRDDLIDQYDGWIQTSKWLAVGPVTRDALRYAAVLRAQHRSLKLPDAIHSATAFGLDCRYFLTADTGIKPSYELYHTRYGITVGPKSLQVLRPEPDVLRGLTEEITQS